jgi:hypothetical protein
LLRRPFYNRKPPPIDDGLPSHRNSLGPGAAAVATDDWPVVPIRHWTYWGNYGYRLYSRKINAKTGKRRNLGTFATLGQAKKHERAVQFFKRGG